MDATLDAMSLVALSGLATMPSAKPYTMRPLSSVDAQAMTSLIQGDGIGWQQTADDISQLLRGDAADVVGAFEEGSGELVSVAALPRFRGDKGEWAWLCYVATAPRARRQGLATGLVASLFQDLAAGTPAGLYGSALGAPLYASKFGFVDRGFAHLVRLPGSRLVDASAHLIGPTIGGLSLVRARDYGLRGIAELDEEVYCTNREDTLRRWAEAMPGAAWVLADDSGRCQGFILGRAASDGTLWLGPLISTSHSGAEALLRAALSGLPRSVSAVQMLAVDVWDHGRKHQAGTSEGLALVDSLGFEQLGAEPSRLMVRGIEPAWIKRAPGARSAASARVFCAAGFEWG